MDFDKLDLTPAEIEELKGPFTTKLAMEAIRLGMAQAISEAHLTPEEFEEMVQKLAAVNLSAPDPMEYIKAYTAAFVGGGAMVGAGSALARLKIERAFANNSDPEMVALKKRIQNYHAMKNDLQTGLAAAA